MHCKQIWESSHVTRFGCVNVYSCHESEPGLILAMCLCATSKLMSLESCSLGYKKKNHCFCPLKINNLCIKNIDCTTEKPPCIWQVLLAKNYLCRVMVLLQKSSGKRINIKNQKLGNYSLGEKNMPIIINYSVHCNCNLGLICSVEENCLGKRVQNLCMSAQANVTSPFVTNWVRNMQGK